MIKKKLVKNLFKRTPIDDTLPGAAAKGLARASVGILKEANKTSTGQKVLAGSLLGAGVGIIAHRVRKKQKKGRRKRK